MSDEDSGYPRLRQTVIDTSDVRGLAEFYGQLLGLSYRPGQEPQPDGIDDPDWINLDDADGTPRLAIQFVEALPRPVWPDGHPPQMLHLDTTVSTRDELERQRRRAEALGASVLLDRTDDPEEPLYVFADPAGHPFCIFVG